MVGVRCINTSRIHHPVILHPHTNFCWDHNPDGHNYMKQSLLYHSKGLRKKVNKLAKILTSVKSSILLARRKKIIKKAPKYLLEFWTSKILVIQEKQHLIASPFVFSPRDFLESNTRHTDEMGCSHLDMKGQLFFLQLQSLDSLCISPHFELGQLQRKKKSCSTLRQRRGWVTRRTMEITTLELPPSLCSISSFFSWLPSIFTTLSTEITNQTVTTLWN